jgi:cytochrome P450
MYVYSAEGVARRLREEIALYVRLSQTTPLEIVGLDIMGLTKKCQLLRACVFETYRLIIEPTSIRYVARPVTISDGDFVQTLNPGTWVSAPHSLLSRDSIIFPDTESFIPESFIPERFLEHDLKSDELVAPVEALGIWHCDMQRSHVC